MSCTKSSISSSSCLLNCKSYHSHASPSRAQIRRRQDSAGLSLEKQFCAACQQGPEILLPAFCFTKINIPAPSNADSENA